MASGPIEEHAGFYGFLLTLLGVLVGAVKWIFGGWEGYKKLQGEVQHLKENQQVMANSIEKMNGKLDQLLISMASHEGGK